MSRRSDHSKEEKVAMIIESGQKIMANEGLRGFSARKVARAIGYTVGTVYNVIGSHDDLILHINAATLDELNAFMSECIQPGLEESCAIKLLAGYYLEFAESHYNRWSALFEYRLPQDVGLPDWYLNKISGLFQMLETPLVALTRQNPLQTKLLAKTLWASLHGICLLGLAGKLDAIGADSPKMMMDRLIDHYLCGVREQAAIE